jgi:ferredoxin
MSPLREPVVMPVAGVGRLMDALAHMGYSVVGPTVREGTIVYGELSGVEDLPVGWTDDQAPGLYRIRRRQDDALFGYVMGPHSWKLYLHPPEIVVWAGTRTDGSFDSIPLAEPPRYAFFGVRPCEVAAICIQDKVFSGAGEQGGFVDATYAGRRDAAFVVAVNCVEPGEVCFCTSMNTGPRAHDGFDVVLTEVVGPDDHYFLAEAGTEAGERLLASAMDARPATRDEVAEVDELLEAAAQGMGRAVEIDGIKELLYANLEHPHWEAIANRCLLCANCTMVCPTCFCATVEDTLSLDGTQATRTRRWDSCFGLDFSYIHGGPLRREPQARYRQWMTHKLASWIDQFGELGCVGCGRCITWCPVGIDITEEIGAFRMSDQRRGLPVATAQVRR